jgi:hypothetical protein
MDIRCCAQERPLVNQKCSKGRQWKTRRRFAALFHGARQCRATRQRTCSSPSRCWLGFHKTAKALDRRFPDAGRINGSSPPADRNFNHYPRRQPRNSSSISQRRDIDSRASAGIIGKSKQVAVFSDEASDARSRSRRFDLIPGSRLPPSRVPERQASTRFDAASLARERPPRSALTRPPGRRRLGDIAGGAGRILQRTDVDVGTRAVAGRCCQ